MTTDSNHTKLRLLKTVEICEVCGYAGKNVTRHMKFVHNRQAFCRFMAPLNIATIVENRVDEIHPFL